MKPARNLGNGDNFEALSVLTFLVLMVVYFWVAGFVKNLMLAKLSKVWYNTSVNEEYFYLLKNSL